MEQPEPKKSDTLAQQRTGLAGDRTAMATQRTHLASERTAMAADRSLMAWLRTGLSMISFGFTIYKFLQYMRDDAASKALRKAAPRNIGLFLIGLGTVSLILGMIQHWRTLRGLRQFGHSPWRFPVIVAGLIALIGVFLFATILGGVEVI